ncbi:MAG TPA: glutathione S-transferase N-terminal domain-containing protein [Acidocella sp.]|jgi:glutathione S-transferase|uniref:glutathione S-transferase N-terminal domain-containing protein n=1 Tax=Acidocella sp. TaxID=50710 RepID=UPI002BB44A3D|nr:glutathione S-transferase N-terminal domain-containing protein [Acidocella sp.]HVE20426.1 glutathione S-transferase N-terminal domain-containing protein [Acidocella sp.]
MKQRLLYDLTCKNQTVRFSPYCWRTKLALAHKNLSYEAVPWHFTDKDVIAFSNQGKVPVLVDGETVISDSQEIAEYLETAYPNEASLFGDAAMRALINFVKAWTEDVLHPAIAPLVVGDIWALIHPKDQDYFRETRERFLGRKLEDFAPQRETYLAAFKKALAPLRKTLKGQSFLAGTAPNYADHIVFGALQWGRLTSQAPLLDDEPEITAWMAAVLGTYGL